MIEHFFPNSSLSISHRVVAKDVNRLPALWLIKLGLMITLSSLTDSWLLVIESARAEVALSPSPIPEASTLNSEVIKVKIQENNDNSEWIRIERKENKVTLLHTRNAKSGFSELTSSLRVVPNFYVWYDHPVSKVMFKPDNCSVASEPFSMTPSSCEVFNASDTLNLPQGIDVRQGKFTIEYTESDVLRTITFRIPDEKAQLSK